MLAMRSKASITPGRLLLRGHPKRKGPRQHFPRSGGMACAFAVYAIENVGHEIEGEYTARPPIAARSPQAKAPSAAFYCFATPVWRCHNLSMCGRYRLSRRKQLVNPMRHYPEYRARR